MKKAWLLVFALLGLVGWWIYGEWFSKPSQVYARLPQIKVGMSQKQVVRLLSVHDTTYLYSDNDSTYVLHYDMSFRAPDAVRVLLKYDTVVAVYYNQQTLILTL